MKSPAILLVSCILLCACKTSPGTGIAVEPLPTQTILENGSVTEQNVRGMKRIRIRIDPKDHQLLENGEGVQVSFRLPDSSEDIGQAVLADSANLVYYFDLPGSEQLDICEYMHYRWVIVYDNTDTSTRGTYLGVENFVMPTTTYNANGSVSQAQCPGPPLP